VDPANGNDLLISGMAEYGLRTVLCAGNEVSQEPRAYAERGLPLKRKSLGSNMRPLQ
jgi:hypothetical protein